MIVDYELAWQRLGEVVASKTQHGREGLLVRMQEIAGECRVPEGELARLLRLYNVEVDRKRASSETDRDELGPLAAGLVSAADGGLPGHDRPEGGHRGSINNGSSERGREAAS